MDTEHYNELIQLSQEIYDQANDKLTNYLSAKYCAVGNNTADQQLEDYLFITEEASAFFLGNAFALLDTNTQEEEIKTFTDNLRRVIKYAHEKADEIQFPPS